ncbi:MAG: flagellar biosynthesis regulatory protein FlaF [Nitrospirae bacterium]|nr:MAG: flagellar biosynthesis regulatory protein FlaF [Nitrospirota bacterium]
MDSKGPSSTSNSQSGREVEASVLEKAAAMLKDCKERWNEQGLETRLNDALGFNNLIWSIFKSEISKGTTPIPVEIRQNLLQLSDFIDKRSEEIKKAPSADKMDILININLNIASGLKGVPSD